MDGKQPIAGTLVRDHAETICPICRALVDEVRIRYRGIPIWRCALCDFCFALVDKVKTDDDLRGLYEELYSCSPEYIELLTQAEREGQHHRLAFAERVFFRLLPRPVGQGRLLDVGCGAGKFMKTAARHGWHVEGVEISPAAASIGQQAGLKIFCGDLASFARKCPEARFDVVTAFEVLEHLPDPLGFLHQVRQVLAPLGYLFLSVPNLRDPFIFFDPRPETWPPVHLNFFSRKALRKALMTAGWQPLAVKTNWLPRPTMRQVIRNRLVRAVLRPPLICLRAFGLFEGNQIAALATPAG